MPEINVAEINKAIRDSAYAAVGLGVLGFQRAQVARHDLTEQLANGPVTLGPVNEQLTAVREQVEAGLSTARTQITGLVRELDERVAPVRSDLEGRIDEFESRLPASTRNAVSQVRAVIRTPEELLRNTLGLDRTA